MIGIKWRQWLAALSMLLFFTGAVYAGFLPTEAAATKSAPEVERLLVVKKSENLLHETALKMLSDPENEKDGMLWAYKVLAHHSYGLRDLANELTAPEMAALYQEKASLFMIYIGGKISPHQFEVLERDLESRKRTYLEGILATAKPTRAPDLDALQKTAEEAARKIHAYSVLAVN